jgi:hypothetical protein
MFAQNLAAAIDAARAPSRLDELAHIIWKAMAAGAIEADAAQLLAERVHAQKAAARRDAPRVGLPPGRPSIFPPRRHQRSPDRAAAIGRRRQLAASGPMPPKLAAMFTTGELAALKIIVDEVRLRAQCEITLAEIAARAGVGRTTVQNAIREAAAGGLVTVQERRRQGQKNLPNVVRIVAPDWLTWLKKQPTPKAGRTGFKTFDPTGRKVPILENAQCGKQRGQTQTARRKSAGGLGDG